MENSELKSALEEIIGTELTDQKIIEIRYKCREYEGSDMQDKSQRAFICAMAMQGLIAQRPNMSNSVVEADLIAGHSIRLADSLIKKMNH